MKKEIERRMTVEFDKDKKIKMVVEFDKDKKFFFFVFFINTLIMGVTGMIIFWEDVFFLNF